jgi:restriction system protein
VYRLTERGQGVLATQPSEITLHFLDQFPEHLVFRQGATHAPAATEDTTIPGTTVSTGDERTPDDLIEDGYGQLRTALIAELQERIASMPPTGFEQLVVDLLTEMGYGGPQENAGLVVGRAGDEGIDGVIKEDRLGLETIYLQAKRWQSSVGRPEIQRFAGALQGQRARKGVFITSSYFSAEARAYANSIQTTIVLIDGSQLAELMVDHNVGVTTAKRLDIKRIDSDYFSVE